MASQISRRCLLVVAFAGLVAHGAEIYFAQGILAGEVTPNSVILQTRFTASEGLVDGDVPGTPGEGRFEISSDVAFAESRSTPWMRVGPERDFILKQRVDGLLSGTEYYYRVIAGRDRAEATRGPAGRFRTLPAAGERAAVSFILTSCMNYANFHDGQGKRPAYSGPDRHLGYPALEPLRALRPDFCVFAGDCVYYDHPTSSPARTVAQLRRKWHEQYVLPRFVQLFAEVPTFWMKDDHDHRKDDSDATGDYAPSHALGIATFREQVPVVDPADPRAVTYRTHRIGRDLQIWMVEGRDYRSPNRMPDGPEKSIWGVEQTAWLRRTLKASTATFKILISPTPMIGPDDISKKDNHVNPEGFRQEADRFFAALREDSVAPNRFFILCGDRHWKYHSVHPTGYQEFCSGALNRENGRGGRAPGNAQSTDPKGLIRQPYKDIEPSGGFLHVAIRSEGDSSKIEFTHYNDLGAVLYQNDWSANQ